MRKGMINIGSLQCENIAQNFVMPAKQDGKLKLLMNLKICIYQLWPFGLLE